MLVSRLSTAALQRRLAESFRRLIFIPPIALFAMLHWLGPVSADPAADSGGAYTLAPGDRIAVTVFGQPELSGDFLVDGSGAVLLPFVGVVTVKDQTVLECQKTIVDRLADGILVHPSVSVRISDLRPLYVLGDVRTPGAYPFRYGATIKGAIALAGGLGASEPTRSAAISEFLSADERVRTLTLQKLVLLVRTARLEAQRDDAVAFAPPASLAALAGEDDASVTLADIVAIERQTFESQAQILKAQRELLSSQKPRIENEIAAINSQIAAGKRQVELVTQEADQYGHLVKQGLGVTNLETQLKVLQASHEGDVWGLTAQTSRLEMESVELDLKIQDLDAAFKKQVMTDLQEAHYRLKEIDLTLASAKELREVRLHQTENPTDVEAERSITVTRNRDGQLTVLPATDSMVLQPGDVVEVKRSPPSFLSHDVRGVSSSVTPAKITRPTPYEGSDVTPSPEETPRHEASETALGPDRLQSAQPEAPQLGRP
jgi:polysaccharide export outer membrane protein